MLVPVVLRLVMLQVFFVAVIACQCISSLAAPSLITVASPEPSSIHTTNSVSLIIAIAPSVILSPLLNVCFDVSWSLGVQSFCKDALEPEWRMNGLDDGAYSVVVTLNSIHPETSKLTVIETKRVDFYVRLSPEYLEKKIYITWPRDSETIAVSKEAEEVEISFSTLNINESDEILTCALNTGLGERSGAKVNCVPNDGSRAIKIDVVKGENEVKAFFVDGKTLNTINGKFGEANVRFDVEYAEDDDVSQLAYRDCIGNICADLDESRVMNVAVISSRSYDRYNEALTMLKSLLFNFKPRNTKLERSRIHFHLIVDSNGKNYFGENFVRMLDRNQKNIAVTFYEFDKVCESPVSSFLESFEFHLSPHYSGRAGYCRLFLHRALVETYPLMESFIAIESDQLFFSDVAKLFEDAIDAMKPGQMVAAPEMYMPWDLIFEDQKQRRKETPNPLVVDPLALQITTPGYHGYGIIGGIMAFDLKKLAGIPFENVWMTTLRRFVDNQKQDFGYDWFPRLNDQDVFNAVFSLRGDLAHIIPCQWNLQYHAAMNAQRLCGDDADEGCLAQNNIFLCNSRPGVVHFMAGSYKKAGAGFFYSEFWRAFEGLKLNTILEGIRVDRME